MDTKRFKIYCDICKYSQKLHKTDHSFHQNFATKLNIEKHLEVS